MKYHDIRFPQVYFCIFFALTLISILVNLEYSLIIASVWVGLLALAGGSLLDRRAYVNKHYVIKWLKNNEPAVEYSGSIITRYALYDDVKINRAGAFTWIQTPGGSIYLLSIGLLEWLQDRKIIKLMEQYENPR